MNRIYSMMWTCRSERPIQTESRNMHNGPPSLGASSVRDKSHTNLQRLLVGHHHGLKCVCVCVYVDVCVRVCVLSRVKPEGQQTE